MDNKKTSKYFIVNDKEIAEIMEVLLGQRGYTMQYKEGVRYSFVRTENIEIIYGKACNILKEIKSKI